MTISFVIAPVNTRTKINQKPHQKRREIAFFKLFDKHYTNVEAAEYALKNLKKFLLLEDRQHSLNLAKHYRRRWKKYNPGYISLQQKKDNTIWRMFDQGLSPKEVCEIMEENYHNITRVRRKWKQDQKEQQMVRALDSGASVEDMVEEFKGNLKLLRKKFKIKF